MCNILWCMPIGLPVQSWTVKEDLASFMTMQMSSVT